MSNCTRNLFEEEADFYNSIKEKLLAENEGKFVVIKNRQMHGGIFSNYIDAHTHAIKTFGPSTPFFLKEVLKNEPINFQNPRHTKINQ